MLIIGLTGSIGMGKSTAAGHFSARGIPVFSADDAVHDLYKTDLVREIEVAFPGTVTDGVVDRTRLMQAVSGNSTALKQLESLVHPAVRKREWQFLEQARASGAQMAVLEIPLLFEVETDKLVDVAIVLTAPPEVQRTRVFDRPGMSEEKFAQLLARQMSDADKRARADFVVDTGATIVETETKIAELVKILKSRPANAFAKWQALYA